MALRKGHGAGRGVPRIEVLPPDELPDPVADARPAVSGLARRKNGRVADSQAAAELGRRGGAAKAKRQRLARSLGLEASADDSAAFAPYRRAATGFQRGHLAELAKLAGGTVSSGPASMVASAALQLGASRFMFDLAGRTGDPVTFKAASALADASRQNLLAAYELATREAKVRDAGDGGLAQLIELSTRPRGEP